MDRSTLKGISAMTAGMACFVVNDTLIKYEGGRIPASQIMCVRGVVTVGLLILMARLANVPIRSGSLTDPRVLARAALDALTAAAFICALPHLPLANATAINAATPILLSLMAVVVLRERIGFAHWLATAVGLVGVLLVVQPKGAGFNEWSLLCLLATVLGTWRDFTTRLIDPAIPGGSIALTNAAVVTLAAAVWSHFQAWVPLTWSDLAVLGAAAGCMAGAYRLITAAMRCGTAATVVPFRYSGLLFACLLGYLVWGESPNGLAWIGIAALVTAGVMLIRRSPAKD